MRSEESTGSGEEGDGGRRGLVLEPTRARSVASTPLRRFLPPSIGRRGRRCRPAGRQASPLSLRPRARLPVSLLSVVVS